eukprot:TRINITY_DN12783_c0_g1_i2.p1 TRINITY_DN12783_c0_g1~~TRINITY_DN12783_c0_g1_i2.p1  ORF type:complete len:494 (+),score=160.45 TRINITY_DN12783_c0_g1_i2:167-1648(+)
MCIRDSYCLVKPFLLQEGDPEPNKGLLAKLEPQFEAPVSLWLVQDYLRLCAVPCLFYAFFHLVLHAAGAEDHMVEAFALSSDLCTQLAFLLGLCGHCALRLGWFKCYSGEHRTKVVGALGLQGNETVLNVKCGKGYWLNGLAKVMGAGGRVMGVDTWDAPDTPFDGQWASENARREEVSTRVEVMNYGDPHYLTYKDQVFDIALSSWLETADEVNYYNALCEMVRVVRPGGRVLLLYRLPCPAELTQHSLQDLGLTQVSSTLISTGYLAHRLLSATKPQEHTPRVALKIERGENAVTDNSPGFEHGSGQCMLYFLSAVAMYCVLGLSTLLAVCWSSLEVPSSAPRHDALASAFLANTAVWLCWAGCEVQLCLAARPEYMLKRVGVFQLWAGYWLQYSCIVLAFNALAWAPAISIALGTGVSSLWLRSLFRVLSWLLVSNSLGGWFERRRQRGLLEVYKENYGSADNKYRKARKRRTHRVKTTDALLGELHHDI